MAVDTLEPGTAAGGSTQESEALRGDSDPPPLEGSSEPTAYTQHFPGPSLEEPRDGGSSSEDPRASMSLTLLPIEPVLQAPVAALGLSFHARKLLQNQEKMAAQHERSALRSLSPVVMILGSLPLIFPHFFDHLSFLYAFPFVPSALPYFSEHSPWFPLYNSLMTPLLPHFKSYHFLLPFLDCQLLPALSPKLFHHYLLSGTSPFTLQSRTIDFLANQRMPAPL